MLLMCAPHGGTATYLLSIQLCLPFAVLPVRRNTGTKQRHHGVALTVLGLHDTDVGFNWQVMSLLVRCAKDITPSVACVCR